MWKQCVRKNGVQGTFSIKSFLKEKEWKNGKGGKEASCALLWGYWPLQMEPQTWNIQIHVSEAQWKHPEDRVK